MYDGGRPINDNYNEEEILKELYEYCELKKIKHGKKRIIQRDVDSAKIKTGYNARIESKHD